MIQSKYRIAISFLLFINFIFISCAGPERIQKDYSNAAFVYLYNTPPDFIDPAKQSEAIEYYAEYLKGKRIFIDPGHGGSDRRNKSASGKVVEADVNLRVALKLGDYLEKAEAEVIFSRKDDSTVELLKRSELANESSADLFISIHHNAPGRSDQVHVNYTSTYYHARQGDYSYEHFDHDLARFIQRDLAYAMGNSGGLASFDGTISDYIVYPGEGFAVLRNTKIPAILVECAFHTNPLEEARLQLEEFNALQAWGIFKGIGKFYKTGFPEILLLTDRSTLSGDKLKLVFQLRDEEGINPNSVEAYFDSLRTDTRYDISTGILEMELEKVEKGEHNIRVTAENKKGKHAFPYHKKILVK